MQQWIKYRIPWLKRHQKTLQKGALQDCNLNQPTLTTTTGKTVSTFKKGTEKKAQQGIEGMKIIARKKAHSSQRISVPLTQMLREAKRSMRLFCYVSIFALLHAALFPHLAAAQAASEQREAAERIVLQGTPDQQLNQALLKVQEIADSKQHTIAERMADESGLLDSVLNFFGLSQLQLEEVDNLEQLHTLLADLNQTAMEQFQQTENQLREKGLPEEILQRHDDTVAHYQQQFADLSIRLTAVLQAGNLQDQSEAMDALDQLMEPQKLKKRHQSTDPNNLPWGTPDASKVRKPARTADELSQRTGISPISEGIQVAALTLPPDIFELVGGPLPQDLEETPDIQITDAIRDLAENQLNDDPVAIYNWVRNNIEYIPSYGSIQGADYTLQHRKGNAFDTASLLIALFRASNIPARYAYGTVQVPVDKVMNWVGGVDVPEAAQQLLGQGGIPNVALINGGRITHIEMEHVWVEAWVDYFPSRGAKHRVGDNWIPLDASFKQYDFTEGQDLEANVPFDAQGLVDDITQSATIDETQGFVQGVDQAAIEAALANYQQQIEDYINNQNPDATVGEVLGIQRIIVQEYQQLAAGLPYELIARTNNYSALPNNLRHRFRYTLGTEIFGRESNRLITFEQSLPELAGKKHALSFRPAAQADEDLINSFIPEPDPDTGEIDPSQLPNTLPGYLIGLVAEFTQDGEIIHSAAAGTMGGELYETLALWSPAFGWDQAVNHPTAGEYRAIGLDLQGANPEEAARLQADVEATQAILEGGDQTEVSALTKNQLVGDLLYSTIYNYLAQTHIQDLIQAQSSNIINYRLPSFGVFSTNLQTSFFFGVPRNISFDGMFIDVDRIAVQGVDKNNDRNNRIDFVQTSGYRASSMEHLIPEQAFSTPNNPAQGISAVKALSIAGAEGQRIWTITQDNLSDALAAINLSNEIEGEIRNAVLAGKVATAHEEPIDFAGGTNTGYLLIDPDTGAGAYLIAGGANGGFLDSDLADILGVVGFGVGLVGAAFSAPLLLFISAIIATILIVNLILTYNAISHRCDGLQGLIALGVIAAVLGVFVRPLIAIVLMYTGLLASNAAVAVANSAACRN